LLVVKLRGGVEQPLPLPLLAYDRLVLLSIDKGVQQLCLA
jgi:hypothetical protein